MTARIHCDADGCTDSYEGDTYIEPVAAGWRRVEYISEISGYGDDDDVKHFSSLACLVRWASEGALRQQQRGSVDA